MSSNSIISDFDSAVNISLDGNVNTITICNKSYLAWFEADYYYLKANHTGNVKRFDYSENLNDYVAALRWRMTSKAWIGCWLLRILASIAPQPTTPIAIALKSQMSIAAVASKPAETVIKLTTAHGEYYDARQNSLNYSIERFTYKYGVRPTAIRMNAIEESGWLAGNDWDGIAVEFVDAVPEDTYYLHYSPKAAH